MPVGRPRRRRRLVAAVAGVLAVVAAAIIAVEVAGNRTGDGTPLPRSEPVVAADAGAPPVTIDDPQTADPCSVVDTTALSAYGSAQVHRNNTQFAGCRVDIVRPDSSVFFGLAFRGPAELVRPPGLPREKLDGRDVYRSPLTDSCWRRIVLSQLNAVDIFVNVDDGGPADDLCEIAEAGSRAAVAAVADGEIGTRARLDETTTLGGTSSCGLLQPADLTAVPGLRSPVPGVGDWECTWDDGAPTPTLVDVTFFLGHPLGEPDGTPIEVAGHPGAALATEDGCSVRFVQRNYTDGSTPYVESVVVRLAGPNRGANPCGTVTALAAAAARKLPPPT